jgi:hypothetical protein
MYIQPHQRARPHTHTHRCILIGYFNNCIFSKHEQCAILWWCDCTGTCRSCFNGNFIVNFKLVFKTIHLCISLWTKNWSKICTEQIQHDKRSSAMTLIRILHKSYVAQFRYTNGYTNQSSSLQKRTILTTRCKYFSCSELHRCLARNWVKCKGKLHPCTGRTAHRWRRGIALLFHDQRH